MSLCGHRETGATLVFLVAKATETKVAKKHVGGDTMMEWDFWAAPLSILVVEHTAMVHGRPSLYAYGLGLQADEAWRQLES